MGRTLTRVRIRSMSPAQEFDFALNRYRECGGCPTCRADVRRAALRLALSAGAFAVAALAIVAAIWLAIVLVTAAYYH